jgi:hypothetical protein
MSELRAGPGRLRQSLDRKKAIEMAARMQAEIYERRRQKPWELRTADSRAAAVWLMEKDIELYERAQKCIAEGRTKPCETCHMGGQIYVNVGHYPAEVRPCPDCEGELWVVP